MRLDQVPVAPDEWHEPRSSEIWAPALDEIIRLRRVMLVNCCVYYHLNDSLISDHQWQQQANQLCYFQDTYGWRAGFYDRHFRDWDASTGYHLPVDDAILRKARQLLAYRDILARGKLAQPRIGFFT